MTDELVPSSDALVQELRSLIEATRGRVAQTVNSELVALYWQVGKRLHEEVLGDERAAYGEQVVAGVARALTAEFGRGFGKRNLHYMARFAEVFPDVEIVHALRSQLTLKSMRASSTPVPARWLLSDRPFPTRAGERDARCHLAELGHALRHGKAPGRLLHHDAGGRGRLLVQFPMTDEERRRANRP